MRAWIFFVLCLAGRALAAPQQEALPEETEVVEEPAAEVPVGANPVQVEVGEFEEGVEEAEEEVAAENPCQNHHCKHGKVCELDERNMPLCVCRDPSSCPPPAGEFEKVSAGRLRTSAPGPLGEAAGGAGSRARGHRGRVHPDPCQNHHCKHGKVCELDERNMPLCVCRDPSSCPAPAGEFEKGPGAKRGSTGAGATGAGSTLVGSTGAGSTRVGSTWAGSRVRVHRGRVHLGQVHMGWGHTGRGHTGPVHTGRGHRGRVRTGRTRGGKPPAQWPPHSPASGRGVAPPGLCGAGADSDSTHPGISQPHWSPSSSRHPASHPCHHKATRAVVHPPSPVIHPPARPRTRQSCLPHPAPTVRPPAPLQAAVLSPPRGQHPGQRLSTVRHPDCPRPYPWGAHFGIPPVIYSLVPGTTPESNRDGVFALDSGTGLLRVQKALDYESTRWYQLDLVARRPHNGTYLASLVSVSIQVGDVNDNRPEFEADPYTAVLAENMPAGTSVVQVTAGDRDTGDAGRVGYRLPAGPGSDVHGLFAVDRETGWVTTLRELDCEARRAYRFYVEAHDHGRDVQLSSRVLVEVAVTDENDNPPRFAAEAHRGSVVENGEPGELAATLRTLDADVSAPHWPPPLASSGVLYVDSSLDFETSPVYFLSFECSRLGAAPISDVATVVVNITDVNEHRPRFPRATYHARVLESATAGELVLTGSRGGDIDGTPCTPTGRRGVRPGSRPGSSPGLHAGVSASDEDGPLNSAVTYSLVGGNRLGHFTVHPEKGELRVASALDWEQAAAAVELSPREPGQTEPSKAAGPGELVTFRPSSKQRPVVCSVPPRLPPAALPTLKKTWSGEHVGAAEAAPVGAGSSAGRGSSESQAAPARRLLARLDTPALRLPRLEPGQEGAAPHTALASALGCPAGLRHQGWATRAHKGGHPVGVRGLPGGSRPG
ncbi:PREDICTED: uncharacterized protein LOC105854586 [Condylura cristata]|uniref:uncharacterized protein LOC105854586 n=1 Tax=Condylura cristata TaxID=143302 RepID=UPI00064377BD|nr:PREDICTED: uncharacterized protein LOC105854586 [Condylura cristata]